MIKIENIDICGWLPTIRGMRNPLNSWDKSDSNINECGEGEIGPNDLTLMTKLANAGPSHSKYRRMITVYVDITAPLYWWKEFDTYKVGTVANSCSTMHKIQAKEFTMDDFSTDHLITQTKMVLRYTINELNLWRDRFNNYEEYARSTSEDDLYSKKDVWWQMIQLLPSSYNQKRTVMFNYEVIANMYKTRKGHKLDEWINFCKWVESLPYFEELIAC